MRKRSFVYTLLLAVLLMLSGCGGGTEEPTPTPQMSLEVPQQTVYVLQGSTYTIPAKLLQDGEEVLGAILTFESSNTDVLQVSGSGTVTPVAMGNAEVTVKYFNAGLSETVPVTVVQKANPTKLTEKCFVYEGRNQISDNGVVLYNTAASMEMMIYGTGAEMMLQGSAEGLKIRVFVDGVDCGVQTLSVAAKKVVLAENLPEGVHSIKVVKVNSAHFGTIALKSVPVATDGYLLNWEKPQRLVLEVYGDSITTGYGIFGNSAGLEDEDGTLTYAYLAAQKLNAEVHIQAQGGISLFIPMWNQETMLDNYQYISPGVNVLEYAKEEYTPDVILINLGTNDVSGIQSRKGSEFALKYGISEFARALRQDHPDAKIVFCYGMLKDDLYEVIQGGVNSVNAEVGNCYFYRMDEVSVTGYNGHPDVVGNAQAVDGLVEFIETILN